MRSELVDRLRATIGAVSFPNRRVLGCLVAGIVFVGGVWGSPPGEMTRDVQFVLTVFLFAVVLWLTEALPYTVSSVLSVTALYGLGVVDSFDAAVTGYASTLVFFLFLVLLLGGTISKVGLDEHVARRLLSRRSTPTGTVRSLTVNLFALAFLIPSAAARTVTFVPVVRQLRETYGLDPGCGFEKSSFLVLGHVNALASMMLMTGGGMAITTSHIINTSVESITWVEWAVYLILPTVLLYWLSAVVAMYVYGVDDTTTLATTGVETELSQSVQDDLDRSLTTGQQVVGGVMAGAVLLWIVGSFIGLPTIVPAVLAVVVLALPGVGVIDADDIQGVSWGILFLLGAMFSILEAMESVDALTYVVTSVTARVPFGAMAEWQIVATLLAIAVLARVWFSTASAAIVVVLPIVLEFGAVLGVNQLFLAFAVLLTIGSTTFFPFNTTSVLVSFDQGPLTLWDVFGFGCVTTLVAVVTIVFAWLVYWPLVG